MAQILICPNGHHWDPSLDGSSQPGSGEMVCLICGARYSPDVTLVKGDHETISFTSLRGDVPASVRTIPGEPAVIEEVRLPDIPGYHVLALIGRGGMGQVYKARDVRLGRLVALKMIATDRMLSPHQLARFTAEAQALAKLQHPNIVQIYEVNEIRGMPYFSLELLEGGSLDVKLAGKPQPPRQVAHLMETVTRAVGYAHEHGIIHRDLKPGNILLGGDWPMAGGESKSSVASGSHSGTHTPLATVKIADFGLAKHLASEDQTQSGAVMGTPMYMSPEQAAGDTKNIGPLSDVYSLGAILFEMLTGRPPFHGLSPVQTMDMIRNVEPIPPRQLQPGVPRDLETICLKCLEKQRDKRYASAADLADDLACFLAGQPIKARRAGMAERVVKWSRRRPALAALVAVSVWATVALAAGGFWSHTQLRLSADRAEKRLQLAKKVVEDMYTQVAEEWLAEEPYKDPLRQEFLEKALSVYKEFAQEDSTDPKIVRETAMAHFRLGQIFRSLNQQTVAENEYGQAIALQELLRDRFPQQAQYRQDLANSYNWLGELFRDGKSLPQAAENYQFARALQEKLAVQAPEEAAYRKELARSHYNLAIVQMDMAQFADGGKHLAEAIRLLDKLRRDFPDVRDHAHELARCYNNRGVFHKETEAPQQAREDYQQAIQLLLKLKEGGRFRAIYKTDLAVFYQNLGNLLWKLGKNEAALEEFGHSRELLERLVDDFPTRPAFRKKLANTYNSLASLLASSKNLPLAEKNWDRAKSLLDGLVRDYPDVVDHYKLLGITIGNLGWLNSERGNLAQARREFEQAIAHLHSALKLNPKSPDCLQALRGHCQSLAETLVQLGDHSAAAAAAVSLAHVYRDRPQDYYYAACFLSRCVPLAEKDAKLVDAPARATVAQNYADQAADMLLEASKRGAAAVQRLPNESEVFGPARTFPRLQKALASLADKAG